MGECDLCSGPWAGFYTYSRIHGKYRTDLSLTFSNGRMTGEGSDTVGSCVIAGNYDANNRECDWIKTYVGAHEVFYKGFRDDKGIWGTWEIRNVYTDGFHIWPFGSEDGEREAAHKANEIPAEVVSIKNRTLVGAVAAKYFPSKAW